MARSDGQARCGGTAGPKLKVLGNSRTETAGTIDTQRDEMILDDLRISEMNLSILESNLAEYWVVDSC